MRFFSTSFLATICGALISCSAQASIHVVARSSPELEAAFRAAFGNSKMVMRTIDPSIVGKSEPYRGNPIDKFVATTESINKEIEKAAELPSNNINKNIAKNAVKGAAKSNGKTLPKGPIVTTHKVPDSVDEFQLELSQVLNQLMTSYKSVVKKNIRVEVMDISRPDVSDFFSKLSKGAFDPQTMLAVSFDSGANINGKRTSACWVQYNSKQRTILLNGYKYSGLFKPEEIVYFLAVHEFGHCMAFHQESMGNRLNLSKKEHELLADKFAIAFFMLNGKTDFPGRLIDFIRKFVMDDLHSNSEELAIFHEKFKRYMKDRDPRKTVSTVLDVFHIATGKVDISS